MSVVDTPLWTPAPTSAAPAEPAGSTRPRWERPSYAVLLLGTALLYLIDLGASGYGNEFYAAAVQAGTKSWKAFFFGSFDSANLITVDKPPASLWVMELSGRLFGFSSWSMLVPNALEGVLAVALLYAAVRRWFGPAAGLAAGAALALTPVAVVMFRFNNPDALMTLLCVVAAYCTVRALEKASTRWIVLAGVSMGFAFLAKSLQPFTIVPGLAAAYLVAAPTGLWRRVRQLLAAGAGIVVGAGWWVAAVSLWPVADRPYIGGSGDNSVLGLAFGYNGLGRITGNESTSGTATGGFPGGAGGGGNGGPGGMFGGSTGIGRLFNDQMGTEIAWLLPTALIGLAALLWGTRRAARTDRTRAATLLWGGGLLITGIVLSYAGGIIHQYYTVELAPAIAALVGIAAVWLWQRRDEVAARVMLAVGLAVTGITAFELLGRTPQWQPWLRYAALIGTVLVAVGLLAGVQRIRRVAVAVPVLVAVVGLGSTAAYAADTASVPHTGSTPASGPAGAGGGFAAGSGGRTGAFPGGSGRRGEDGGLPGGLPGGGLPGGGLPGGGLPAGGLPGAGLPGAGLPGGDAGGADGLGGAPGAGQTANSAVTDLLKSTDTTWAAATIGSMSAAPLELASGKAVMSIGGFNGADPAPTLEKFQQYVAQGKVRYFIAGGGGRGGPGGGGTSITSWVESHFASTTVGGTTVYDLTKATS